ncbi:MAG TPA: heavy-metal-associated domain-containing protein [Solimonas sp.]|nr:heavy-metal-associated domain-containing protein [Solimonas sp.]
MIRTLTAALLAALLSFSALAQDAPRTIQLHVDGLVCAFCAQGISKKLGKMDATAEVLVSLENGLVAVALKPGQDLADQTLRETLTEAGYSVTTIERKAETLDEVRARLKAKP